MNVSAAIANVWARGVGPEARGKNFQSKARLFPLATSLAPMAWPVGMLSRRTVMSNAGWRDSVFVERLWKSVKCKEVYLHAYGMVNAAQQGLAHYVTFDTSRRPHSALDRKTPDEVYYEYLPAQPRQTPAGLH